MQTNKEKCVIRNWRDIFAIGKTVRILDFPAGCWSTAKIVYQEGNLVELEYSRSTFIKNVKKYIGQEASSWDFSDFKESIVTNVCI